MFVVLRWCWWWCPHTTTLVCWCHSYCSLPDAWLGLPKINIVSAFIKIICTRISGNNNMGFASLWITGMEVEGDWMCDKNGGEEATMTCLPDIRTDWQITLAANQPACLTLWLWRAGRSWQNAIKKVLDFLNCQFFRDFELITLGDKN